MRRARSKVVISAGLAFFLSLGRAGSAWRTQEIKTEEDAGKALWTSFCRLRTELGFRALGESAEIAAWARFECRSRALARESKSDGAVRTPLVDAAMGAGLYFRNSVVVSLEMPRLDTTLFRDMILAESDRQGQRLWGDFDIGGMGIVSSGPRYFVTIGMLASMTVVSVPQAVKTVRARIDRDRAAKKLSSIAWKNEYMEEAQIAAERAAAGSVFDFSPPKRRHAFLVKWETTDLIPTDKVREEYLTAYLRQGGIGVVFGRTGEYPGGRYFLALLLVTKTYAGLPDDFPPATRGDRSGMSAPAH